MAKLPSYEQILNDMNIPRQQKLRCYWQILKQTGYSKKDGEIIWDRDNIKGFKVYKAMESINIIFTI